MHPGTAGAQRHLKLHYSPPPGSRVPARSSYPTPDVDGFRYGYLHNVFGMEGYGGLSCRGSGLGQLLTARLPTVAKRGLSTSTKFRIEDP